jgi:hypothetical protein
MHIFLAVHPFGKSFGHLVGIVVEILAVHRLADIDPDLSSVKSIQRMRVLGCPRPDLVSACDIDGYKRNSCFDSEVGSSVLEFSELTGVGSCAFRENEADVALFDFLFCFDETSDGVTVTVNSYTAADAHDKAAEFAVVSLEI